MRADTRAAWLRATADEKGHAIQMARALLPGHEDSTEIVELAAVLVKRMVAAAQAGTISAEMEMVTAAWQKCNAIYTQWVEGAITHREMAAAVSHSASALFEQLTPTDALGRPVGALVGTLVLIKARIDDWAVCPARLAEVMVDCDDTVVVQPLDAETLAAVGPEEEVGAETLESIVDDTMNPATRESWKRG